MTQINKRYKNMNYKLIKKVNNSQNYKMTLIKQLNLKNNRFN